MTTAPLVLSQVSGLNAPWDKAAAPALMTPQSNHGRRNTSLVRQGSRIVRLSVTSMAWFFVPKPCGGEIPILGTNPRAASDMSSDPPEATMTILNLTPVRGCAGTRE